MLPGLENLLVQCAPNVAQQTMLAVVQTESAGNPWTLNVNGAQRLRRQPATRAEATSWAEWLVRHGYSVDIGLMQVNSRQLPRFGLSAAQLFDPCTNLATGARILSEFFGSASQQLGSGPAALRAALSAYNTGNFHAGLDNGYVGQVYMAAARPAGAASHRSGSHGSRPPLVETNPAYHAANQPEMWIFGSKRANAAENAAAAPE